MRRNQHIWYSDNRIVPFELMLALATIWAVTVSGGFMVLLESCLELYWLSNHNLGS